MTNPALAAAFLAVVSAPIQAATPPITTPITGAVEAMSGKLKLFDDLKEVIVAVSSRVKPWVVHIEAVQKRGDQKYKVTGSGLILTASGFILTNHHLIDEAKLVTVTLPDGTKLEAKVVGSDKQTDLAVLRIETKTPCPEPKLGDSEAVSVGEWIIAVGNPYGFDRTVYFGIISGKGRSLASLNPYQESDSTFDFTTDFIQTDASIDPGSSGGPLVNLRGEVIGINSMGLGRGMSFTIPINTAKVVAEKLMSRGKLARGWVGLSLQPLTQEMAAYFRLPDGGVLVSEVAENSPALHAGFRQGDIVLELNGKKVKAENEEELNQVSQVVWTSDVGSRLSVRIWRDGRPGVLAVTVGEQPKTVAREVETDWGFNVKEITQDIFRDYMLDDRNGVLVSFVEAGTAAGEARLREGDVIVSIEGTAITTLQSFEKAREKLKGNTRPLLVLAKRRKDSVFVLLEPEKYKPKPRD